MPVVKGQKEPYIKFDIDIAYPDGMPKQDLFKLLREVWPGGMNTIPDASKYATVEQLYKALADTYMKEVRDTYDVVEKREGQMGYLSISTDMKTLGGDVRTYVYSISWYDGMSAHGMYEDRIFHVDMKAHRRVSLNDVFRLRQTKKLSDLIVKSLARQVGVSTLAELRGYAYFWEGQEPMPSDNFYMDKDTVSFVYNPYEIAPYAVGKVTVNVPKKEIRPLMRPPFDHY